MYYFQKTGRRAFSKIESNFWKFKMEHTYNYCQQLHLFEVFNVSYYGEYLAFHMDTVKNDLIHEHCRTGWLLKPIPNVDQTYCKYILLGIVIIFPDQLWVVYYHFSITAHVQGKFITDFYLVRHGYLYLDTQADLVIVTYMVIISIISSWSSQSHYAPVVLGLYKLCIVLWFVIQ